MNVFCGFWRPFSGTAIITSFLIAVIIIGVMSCVDNPSGLVPPNFTIVSIIFTGDSIGSKERPAVSCQLERRCARGKDESYCEVTVTWRSPVDQTVLNYTLHRSTEPGISSGGSGDRIIGTTTDTLLVDSDSLQWAITYYYAVIALSSDSTVHWSDEGSITTPLSQLPTPSQISAVDLPMGRCILTWTTCPDEDFSYYTLVRRQYSGSLHGDTLGIFYGAQDTTFVDSVIPVYMTRYYQIATTDTQDLSVKSNMLAYINDYGLPWRMDQTWMGLYSFDRYQIIEGTFTPSWGGEYVFFVEVISNPEPPYYITHLRSMCTENMTSQTLSIEECFEFVHVPGMNAVLISWLTVAGSKILGLYDELTLNRLDRVIVDWVCDGMLVIPYSGTALIHPEGSSSSLVLDLSMLEIVDTRNYSFSEGQMLEGIGAYIWGVGGGLRRVDPVTYEIMAYSSFDVHGQILASSNGELCFVSEAGAFYRCDPISLAMLYSVDLPFHDNVSLVEVQDTIYAYLYTNPEPMAVYNTENLVYTGDVVYEEGMEYVDVIDMISLPKLTEIWCTCRYFDFNKCGVFSISK
ncbi:MAG: hypothetical protein KAW14_06720 [Candidatus Aegiribacteria sp.]|nr:hypothetical protein [Candidatus Aegiribacteria sp.]